MTKKDISFENVKAVVFIKASHKKGNKKIFAGYDTDGSCRLKKYDEETNQKITINEPLDENVWNKFKLGLEAAHLAEWRHDYFKPLIHQTETWEVDITMKDGSLVEFSGANAFPPNWKLFIKLIKDGGFF